MAVKAVPEGYRTYTPYYVVEGAAGFIEFLKAAFGAEETFRLPMPGGRLGHAELRIGDSMVMLADANPPEHPQRQMSAMLYVDDCDAVFKKALAAGAKEERALADQFYGDRTGGLTDKWGNYWTVATHVRDVSPEEMAAHLKSQA